MGVIGMADRSELMRDDRDIQKLLELLLEGASSSPGQPLDDHYFDDLRRQVRSRDLADRLVG